MSQFLSAVLTVADFNKDGKLDLAIAGISSTGGNVNILLGRGDGSFQSPATSSIPGALPNSIVAADVNADSNLDLLIGSSAISGVSEMLGNGDGTFQKPKVLRTDGVAGVTAADFNHDGAIDLLVTSYFNANGLSLLIGNGKGGFSQGPTFDVCCNASVLATADFNGDAKPDVAIANFYNVPVLLNIF